MAGGGLQTYWHNLDGDRADHREYYHLLQCAVTDSGRRDTDTAQELHRELARDDIPLMEDTGTVDLFLDYLQEQYLDDDTSYDTVSPGEQDMVNMLRSDARFSTPVRKRAAAVTRRLEQNDYMPDS